MRWTAQEEEQLSLLYPSTPNKEIAITLGRSKGSVESKAQRMGLRKADSPPPTPEQQKPPHQNDLDLITRNQTMKLDKVELLRVSWSLLYMQQRELANPNITDAQRQKQMNGLANLINTINSITKNTPDDFYDEKQNLSEEFTELVIVPPEKIRSRRVRRRPNDVVIRFETRKKGRTRRVH